MARYAEHVVLAQERPERLHRLRHAPTSLHHVRICSGRPFVPSPGVLERLDLRRRPRPVAFGEQHVVVGVRVERRIEVDEIDRPVGDVPSENVQVVAVEELVFLASSQAWAASSLPAVHEVQLRRRDARRRGQDRVGGLPWYPKQGFGDRADYSQPRSSHGASHESVSSCAMPRSPVGS